MWEDAEEEVVRRCWHKILGEDGTLPYHDSLDSSLDKVHVELPLQWQWQPDSRLWVPKPAGVDTLLQEVTGRHRSG